MNIRLTALAALAACAFGAQADLEIEIDLSAKPKKDITKAKCNAGFGFNQALDTLSQPSEGGNDIWFVTNKYETARTLKKAGATLMRLQCANEWWRNRNEKTKHGYPKTNPKAAFEFYKANGIKVFVCLDVWRRNRNRKEGDKFYVPSQQEAIDVIKWIVDNGYKDQVAGFECGNEQYGLDFYPELAPLWKEVMLAARKIWGKDVKFGISLAELFELNPDIKHIRDRFLSNQDFKRDWTYKGAYFTAANFNKYSAKFVVAMKECGALDMVTHIVWHGYGAETPYSCSYYGIQRWRNFIEAFPELKGKQWWLTEMRERSDEDNHCQRFFRESLMMGHVTMMMLMQPEVDAFLHHQVSCLSGAIYQTDGKTFYDQWYDGTQVEIEDPGAAYGKPIMEVGHMGEVYRIMNQALTTHPLVLSHGTSQAHDTEDIFYTSARFTDQVYARRRAIKEGKTAFLGLFGGVPEVDGELEYMALVNKQKNRFCLLMVNSKQTSEKVTVRIPGKLFTAPLYRTVSCPAKFLDVRAVPGEGKYWQQLSWEDADHGCDVRAMEPYKDMKPKADTFEVTIEPNTFQSVSCFLRNPPKK